MFHTMGRLAIFAGLSMFALCAGRVMAESIFTYDTGAGAHAATANFDVTGNVLTIALTNYGTTAASTNSTADGLSGFVFDLRGVTLTAGNAGTFASGTLVDVNLVGSGGNQQAIVQTYSSGSYPVNHFWGAPIPPVGYDYGLLAAGLAGLNNGTQAYDGTNLNGADGEIIPQSLGIGDTMSNKDGWPSNTPYVLGSATFQFTISGGTLTTNNLGDGAFLFGTVPDVTSDVPGPVHPSILVPLPAAAWLALPLLAALMQWRRQTRVV